MTREEAAKEIIRVLQKPATSTGATMMAGSRFEQALCLAVNALRQPSGCVRTDDRLPAEADGNPVMAVYKNAENGFMLHEVVAAEWMQMMREKKPEMYPYWMPLPPLPETVGLEGTKSTEANDGD